MSQQLAYKPRVIIHGCGNVGQRIARFCFSKGWPIVAAYNREGDKVGQDLGLLAGLDKPVAVLVEDAEKAAIQRGSADIAVIATTGSDLLENGYAIYEMYLSAGINVIVHGSQPHNPFFENPDIAQKIERVARANQATFSGSTIWDTSRVWAGILAAGNCVEIDRVLHTASAEPGLQNPVYEAATGIGLTPSEFEAKFSAGAHPLETFLHGPPVMVLQNLGCTISHIEKRSEAIVLEFPRYSPHSDTHYPEGVVGGIRVIAEVFTEEGIRGEANVEYRLFEPGEIETMKWRVEGLPSLEISLTREDAGNLSAASLFNRIPDVIAARPGIVEIFQKEMGPMRSTALL